MPLLALAFLLGDGLLHQQSCLPPYTLLGFLCGLGVIFIIIFRKYMPICLVISGLCMGYSDGAIHAHRTLSWHLPLSQEAKTIQIRGIIKNIVTQNNQESRFILKCLPGGALVNLHWKNAFKLLHTGDEWQFHVRLKQIHGTANEAGFDEASWNYEQGIRASGYVVDDPKNIFIKHHIFNSFLMQWRDHVRNQIISYLPNTPTAHWLLTLTVGDRSYVSQDEWHLLQNTGTNHLMAIAGLHLGMLGGLILYLFHLAFKKLPAPYFYFFNRKTGVFVMLVVVFYYAMLANFSLPTERAFMMIFILSLYEFFDCIANPWHVLSMVMFIVLFIHPASILDMSFWLSYTTIALILFGMNGRLRKEGWWWKVARVQYVISMGLLPLSVLFFQQYSLTALFANAIAIPWMMFAILPICFIALFFLPLSGAIVKIALLCADISLQGLMWVLATIASLPLSVIHWAMPNSLIFLFSMLACLLCLLPRHTPGKYFGFILFLPLVLYHPERPLKGDYWVTVLDVSEGLSIVIQTASHTLVFDTGAKFDDQYDMGERVVLPFLYQYRIHRLDALVISHPDNDHRGGSDAIFASMPVKSFFTTAPDKINHPSSLCLAGKTWQWDGVEFEFIYPDLNHLNLDNNSSCVLRVSNQFLSTLLPGDIEKLAENALVASGKNLHSNILIAPHHGSKTSGVWAFVNAVNPQWVVYSTGYLNRYHFPHSSITALYDMLSVGQFNTANEGEITFKIHENTVIGPYLYRREHRRFYMS